MVAGDAVNTAARVQASAHPGQVLADEATRRLTAFAIAFADTGEHLLKGKSDRLQLWRATRVVSGLAGSQRHDRFEAPLCGRDTELRALRDQRLLVGLAASRCWRSRLFQSYRGPSASRTA